MPEKYLIVSLGSIGKRHLANLRRLCPDAQIGVLRLHTALSDSLPEGADLQFSSLPEALAFGPSAAIIAGPASAHLEMANVLAAAGISLLVEKPLADVTLGVPALLKLCKAADVPLLVGYNLRFLPSLLESKRLIDSGVIGRVLGVRAEVGQYLPDWRPTTRYQDSVSAQCSLGGGALLELSHEIDYLYWMFGMPQCVSARGGRYGELEIDVEDMVTICLEYADPDRLIEIHLDFLQRAPARGCKFIGELGTLVWNGMTDGIELFRVGGAGWEKIDGYVQPERNQMYVDELRHFLDCVHKKESAICDGVQGYDVLTIVEAARTSMQTGRSVPVNSHIGT